MAGPPAAVLSGVQCSRPAGPPRAGEPKHHEQFNVYKNGVYELEHNYEHGKNGLAFVLYVLKLLAFVTHQILLMGDRLDQQARSADTLEELWNGLRMLMRKMLFETWTGIGVLARRLAAGQDVSAEGPGGGQSEAVPTRTQIQEPHGRVARQHRGADERATHSGPERPHLRARVRCQNQAAALPVPTTLRRIHPCHRELLGFGRLVG
jgi:hypothetical protein